MSQMNTKKHTQGGFTLIELSIVLVIIGLIVGGVLVGQDLIKGAEIRATVSQLEKYDSAANTFRNKYGGLPGDMLNPDNFFAFLSGQTIATSPDGDGLLEANGHASGVAGGFGAEAALFWGLLSRANLINDNTTAITTYSGNAVIASVGDTHMPATRMSAGRIHIGSAGGLNYYTIIDAASVAANTGQVTATHSLTPIDAYQIDVKMDDGVAATGRVNSMAPDVAITAVGGGSASPQATGVDDCYATGTGEYALSTAPDTVLCSLRIRTSF